ncbi:hypothetical protein QBC40DRAFT_47988 [Triangularia verruculosa]|uniref:Zn(2)-C6 fungal-type domain-containing protein n=1 Tax=Triangularia verruculosa TaxID=2587418 RepID=A0AAN7AXA9_9PEZI|nr:hypothetical protein QBC40DRAFT_47988 [Triangularia verruculosa]
MASRITPMSDPAATLPEARSHSPWRRSACDRCRSQKLRCTRKKEDDTSTPCTRCLRIRFPCFTSPAKPPGRLAHKRQAAAAAAAANNVPLCGVEQRDLPFVSLPGSGHGMPLADPMTCGNALYGPWTYAQQGAQHPLVMEDNSLSLAWADGGHGMDSFDFSVHANPLLMETHSLYDHHHIHPSTQHQTPVVSIPSPPQYQQVQGFSFQDGSSTKTAPSSKPRPSDPGVLLAGLQQNLSKQLLHAKSLPREFSILDTLSSRPANKTADGFDPLASVLISTCDLIEVSQLFHRAADIGTPQSSHKRSPSINDDGGISMHGGSRWPSPASNASQIPSQGYSFTHSASSSTAASSPSSSTIIDPALGGTLPTTQRKTQQLSSANLLTMVSCYLQLITIYDAIFAHVLLEAAFSMTRRSNGNNTNMQHALAHAMPIDLSRGYPGRHESFGSQHSQTSEVNHWQRAALLAQMVDRQLEGVERALGLPREYCVSTCMRMLTGEEEMEVELLSGREARGLLGVLLGGTGVGMMYGDGEVMTDGFVAASVEQEGGSIVTLLREKLGGLLQSLAGDRC